ncbi:MAG: GTP-binding protein [Alphaproteobacteria bacterium]|nr:GTP-binding protein [Alphaproteobacteria bacterium]
MSTTQIPVTVLTGYLGAGKTTLLNRILSENHGRKYAVIINEFGEVGIDNEIVVGTDEEIFEMNNGCICCTVRGDLIRTIGGLMKRAGKLDGIIVETTGLADPAPVAQTFFTDDEVRAKTRLDAVVTLVDAKHFPLRLEDSREAEDQVAFADVILLNKTDLVSPEELKKVEARIRQINPYAAIHRTAKSAIDIAKVLDKGAFDLQRILTLDPHFLEGGHHHHDHDHDPATCTDPAHDHSHDHHHQDHDHDHDHHHHGEVNPKHADDIFSVSATIAGDVDPDKFQRWITDTLRDEGQNILRSKGILSVKGAVQRYVFQAVHMIADSTWGQKWREGEKRGSKIVFIGRHLDAAKLNAGFEACRE